MKRTTILALLAVLGLLLTTGQAIAAGTLAGTLVTNQATVDYQVGGVDQPPATSVEAVSGDPTTDFVVDSKINVTVTTSNTAPVTITPGGTAGATFTITNTGNDTQDFLLTPIALSGGQNVFSPPVLLTDNFDSSTAVVFYLESGANAGYQATEDTTPVTYLDEMVADEDRTVHLVITAANTQVQDDIAVYALRATALEGGVAASQGAALTNDSDGDDIDAEETVYADPAGSDDAQYDASHSVRSAFQVSTATLTITKSASVYDTGSSLPSDTYAIPGAVIEYTIAISNTGSSTATAVTLVDEIPANTYFYVLAGPTGGTAYAYSDQSPFLPATPTWVAAAPAADVNGVDTDITAVQITVADIAPAGSASVTFYVKIQ